MMLFWTDAAEAIYRFRLTIIENHIAAIRARVAA